MRKRELTKQELIHFASSERLGNMTRIVVVGGGLSGVTSALAIADSSPEDEIILVESRAQLGGRVSSIKDPKSGLLLDNCQHACFRVYDCFLQLLARCGARDSIKLQAKTDLPFLQVGGGRIASLSDGRLEPPNHMAGSMIKFPFLSLSDKIAMRKVIKELSEMTPEQMSALDDLNFEQWLIEKGQSQRAIDRFWGFFVLAALNIPVSQASAGLSAFLFQRGLFGDAHAFDVGAFTSDLSDSLHPHLLRTLEESGVEVKLSSKVNSISKENGLKVCLSKEIISCEKIVVALPHHLTGRLLSEFSEIVEAVDRLEYRSLIGIHALHSAEVLPESFTFAVCVDEPIIQMLFNKNSEIDEEKMPEGIGQWVSVPVSCGDEWLDWDDEQFLEEYRRVVKGTYPDLWNEPDSFVVIRNRKATFAPLPGSEQYRLSQDLIAKDGIYIAGAWTNTDWPSTMEGAVRSGLLAASSLLNENWNPEKKWRWWPSPPKRKNDSWRIW
jgi:squalene-associated FAD-dependent desaturase